MKNYGKIFKILMWVLTIISVGLLVWGFAKNFGKGAGDTPVDVLLYWSYIMVGIAIVAVVVVGLIIGIKNNPKSLVKLGIGLAAVAVICLVAYLLAPGNPAVALTSMDQPSAGILKLTDTILNLTYFAGGAAILSIIVGEIVMAARDKK